MSWLNAYVRGLVIFAYFLIATVVVPNFVLRLNAVGSASAIVQDLIVLAIWGVALITGLFLLRQFQRRGII